MNVTRRLLVSSVDFGFGAAGKLLSILRHMTDAELVVLGSELLRQVQETGGVLWGARWVDRLEDVDLRTIDAALVVLDPLLADRLTAAGTPVVYVDSLPHMWSDADPICERVFSYCAQRYKVGLTEPPQALAGVKAFKWVDPLAPISGTGGDRLPMTAVVNVGGVHSPFSVGNDRSPYVEVVVAPAVEALTRLGYTTVVTGNVDERTAEELRPKDVGCGVVEHERFVNLLHRTDLLLTSPGMTTMMEAGRAGIDTVLLPPQNLSQIVNADVMTGGRPCSRIDWPAEWFPYDAVEAAREHGEEAALELIYESIATIRAKPEASGWLTTTVQAHIRARSSWLKHAVVGLDRDGAREVADEVAAAVLWSRGRTV